MVKRPGVSTPGLFFKRGEIKIIYLIIKKIKVMENKYEIVEEVTQMLKDFDGEMIEFLLVKLGMTDQILRQLVLKADSGVIIDLLLEKQDLHSSMYRD
jgi:hypothetical protein